MSTLENFNMVIALSENTINYQFESLYQDGLIPTEWNALVSEKEKKAYLFLENQLISRQIFNDNLKDQKDQSQYDIQIITQEEFSRIKNQRNNLSYGWEVKLGPPLIEIASGKPKELLFKLTFRSGQLTSYNDNKETTYQLNSGTEEQLAKYHFVEKITDLSAARKLGNFFNDQGKLNQDWQANLPTFIELLIQGKVTYFEIDRSFSEQQIASLLENLHAINESQYVFRVPIGSLEINETTKILHQSTRNFVDKVITSNSSLTAKDFKIESVYLDYQNANISDFDQELTNLPTTSITIFQKAVTNFFQSVLRGSQHSHILGYGLTIKEATNISKARFVPSLLRFSTTYDQNPQYSALNFLVAVDKPNLLSSADYDLEQNLIRRIENFSSTPADDGVIMIDKSLFIKKIFEVDFLPALTKSVQETFPDASYRQAEKKNLYEWNLFSSELAENHSYQRDSWPHNARIIAKKKIESELKIEFTENKIEFTATFDVENNCIFYNVANFCFFETEEKLGTAIFSTRGSYSENKGQQGSIKFNIQPGVEGQIAVTSFEFKELLVGLLAKPKTSQIGRGIGAVLIEPIIQGTFAFDLVKFTFDLSNSLKDFSSKIEKDIKDKINNFSNSVILPLGQVYMYKDIYQDQDNILMKLSYSPK